MMESLWKLEHNPSKYASFVYVDISYTVQYVDLLFVYVFPTHQE